MAVYSVLSKNRIASIAAQYDLEMISYEVEANGSNNSNYLLSTTKGQYMLTLFEGKSREEVEQFKTLLELCLKENFQTTEIIVTKKGQKILLYKNKFLILKKYITGKVHCYLNEKMLFEAGVALAKFNKISIPSFLDKDEDLISLNILNKTVIGKNIDENYENWLSNHLESYKKSVLNQLPKRLIHSDLFWDNILFENEAYKAIIDLEDVCAYARIYDIGMAAVGLCTPDTIVDLKRFKHFLAGYQSIEPLTKIERETLQYAMTLSAVATSSWRFWKYNVEASNPERVEKYLQMVQIAKNIEVIPKTTFLKLLDIYDE